MECIKQDPVSLNRILWLDALKCFAMFFSDLGTRYSIWCYGLP